MRSRRAARRVSGTLSAFLRRSRFSRVMATGAAEADWVDAGRDAGCVAGSAALCGGDGGGKGEGRERAF